MAEKLPGLSFSSLQCNDGLRNRKFCWFVFTPPKNCTKMWPKWISMAVEIWRNGVITLREKCTSSQCVLVMKMAAKGTIHFHPHTLSSSLSPSPTPSPESVHHWRLQQSTRQQRLILLLCHSSFTIMCLPFILLFTSAQTTLQPQLTNCMSQPSLSARKRGRVITTWTEVIVLQSHHALYLDSLPCPAGESTEQSKWKPRVPFHSAEDLIPGQNPRQEEPVFTC